MALGGNGQRTLAYASGDLRPRRFRSSRGSGGTRDFKLLDGGDRDALGAGADQGIGFAEPVVGLVFSVAADSAGQAMKTAVDVATEALGPSGRGFFNASVLLAASIPEVAPPMSPHDPVFSPATGSFAPNCWRWTGTGSEAWHTRVEVCVDGDSARLLAPAAQAVSKQLEHGGAEDRGGRADQGTGLAAPAVGLTFMVAADEPGQAAQMAVDVAVLALGTESRRLYGVSVFRASDAPTYSSDGYPPLVD